MRGMWRRGQGLWPVGHRQTKGAANRDAQTYRYRATSLLYQAAHHDAHCGEMLLRISEPSHEA
jgi:hypothetical protein